MGHQAGYFGYQGVGQASLVHSAIWARQRLLRFCTSWFPAWIFGSALVRLVGSALGHGWRGNFL
eukprot:5829874-Amphidinium_carterae.1